MPVIWVIWIFSATNFDILCHFLVAAFSLKEKARLLLWVVFFSFSADNLTLNGPLFYFFNNLLFICSINFLRSRRSWIVGSILALNHNIFMFPKVEARPKGLGFFGTMRLFFEKYRVLSKGTPLRFLKFSVSKNVS